VIACHASDAVPEPALPFHGLVYRSVTARSVLVFDMPEDAKAAAVGDITRWLAQGRLRHPIGARFPLEATREAHEAMEAGAFGKVPVTID
jgi:NADPH:quinone reductase